MKNYNTLFIIIGVVMIATFFFAPLVALVFTKWEPNSYDALFIMCAGGTSAGFTSLMGGLNA